MHLESGEPSPFGPWKSWSFWQHSFNGKALNESIDLDRFNGPDHEVQTYQPTTKELK